MFKVQKVVDIAAKPYYVSECFSNGLPDEALAIIAKFTEKSYWLQCGR
jgi:hypothetical protein